MMMMPSIISNNLFNDFFDDPWFTSGARDFNDIEKKVYGHNAKNLMSTDVKEKEDGYELIMDLPGFKKDEVSASLENGYLTIKAEKAIEKDEEGKKKEKYIRKERYSGSCQRSFYVGDHLSQEDIKASFQHGILTLNIPKVTEKAKEPKTIAIEG